MVAADGVFSSGFDNPKVKLSLDALLSVLDDPVPNTTLSQVPNLNPGTVAGSSDFLSSLEVIPNLKPSDELPNLNPEKAVVSLEVASDDELPNCAPNVNPLDDEEDSDDVPNLNSPEPEPSDVPNLNPPGVEVEELEIPAADEPKTEDTEKQKLILISQLLWSP